MSNDFITQLLLQSPDIAGVIWLSDLVVEISRKKFPPFTAAVIKEKLVETKHVEPFVGSAVSVIANFPKIGMWRGAAIDLCEQHGKAWGQWGVLLRALGNENPETTVNPEIAFSRRALSQHSRVKSVGFIFDHLLNVEHSNGKQLRVGLLYEYDLTGDDVREAWDRLGSFDLLLKTNPNGSILADASDVAAGLGAKVFGIRDTLSYLAKGTF